MRSHTQKGVPSSVRVGRDEVFAVQNVTNVTSDLLITKPVSGSFLQGLMHLMAVALDECGTIFIYIQYIYIFFLNI